MARQLAIAIVVALVLAVGVDGLLRVDETVALPPPGTYASAVTTAGTPVWIGHRGEAPGVLDGEVWVVDATLPGSDRLAASCPGAGQLLDPVTGDRFDLRGRVVDASTETGLVPLRTEVDGDRVRILERLPAYPALGLGAADTAAGVDCRDEVLQRHPGGG